MRIDAEELMEDRKLGVNKPKEPKNNNVVIAIIIAIVIIIAMIGILLVIKKQITKTEEVLKVYVDNKEQKISDSAFLFEDDKIYVNVKKIARIINYDAHSGEYKIEAEDPNKVFVENKEETASMFLNSSVISKTTPNINDEYRNYEMSEPAREINGDIFVISDGIEIACNVKLKYNLEKKRLDIKTLDYYYDIYNETVKKEGLAEISNDFENKKALLYDRLVVKNEDGKYGVINSKNEEIIGTRYGYIQFDEYTQEFTITNSQGKVGIDYINGETKIKVQYDDIKSIDKKDGLYLIKNKEKYGIINNDEKIVIHCEYDEIGVNITPYYTGVVNTEAINKNIQKNENNTENNLRQYIFYQKLVPVKQNNMWGFFDIEGKKVIDLKYTGIGCNSEGKIIGENVNNTNKKTTGNLLTIDEYELIVVENNGKYGLINVDGKEILSATATDMFSITNAGVKYYYMKMNEKTYNIESDLLEKMNIKKKTETNIEENIENETENNTLENIEITNTTIESIIEGNLLNTQ